MNPDNNTQQPVEEFSNIGKPENVFHREPEEVSDAGHNAFSPTGTAGFGPPPVVQYKSLEPDGIQIDKQSSVDKMEL